MRHFIFVLCFPFVVIAQSIEPLAQFHFQPNYQLPGNAANIPGPRINAPNSNFGLIYNANVPLIFKGQQPSQSILNFLDPKLLPTGSFSVELWMVNHVNQPVGALISARSKDPYQNPDWLLGYFGNEITFGLKEKNSPELKLIESKITRGWKKYWLHVVATYDGQTAKLYYNGIQKGEVELSERAFGDAQLALELSGYLNNEPYMEIANLVKALNLYDQALSEAEIKTNLNAFQASVESGTLFPDLFHFTAGPYLHYVTPNSINITWETNTPAAKATIHYGEQLPFDNKLDVNPHSETGHYIHTITLDNLKPDTPYFYEIEVENPTKEVIKSGTLTFATAPEQDLPFTFAVIGDTEARPHVNFQVARLIWDERPNFVINLGDLTDGGQEPHKFEWTHEYFMGVVPLASRIPFFTVPGNGESDLYWYKRYHKLPETESFYSFQYGNAEFFMLNSNERDEFALGGLQYQWLEKALQNSTAQWKVACHHHAPYSSDENDYGDSWKGKSDLGDLQVRQIVPLYEKYGVDVVLFGHLHTYQRTLPILENMVDQKNGVIYIQGGGAGGNLEDFAPTHSWFSAKTYRGHHYFTFTVQREEVLMRMYDSEGNMKDFMQIRK